MVHMGAVRVTFAQPLVALLSRRSVRAAVVAALCLMGVAIYVATVDPIYAVRDWLFWRLLVLWGWCALLNGAYLAFWHHVLVRWLKIRDLPVLETLVTSAGIGVVAFTMAMYGAGVLALYRSAFAIAMPLAMIVVGGPGLLRFARQAWQARIDAIANDPAARAAPNPLASIAVIAGALGLGLLYLQSMTPAAIDYDPRWYHLTVAQDYAREGRIVPFPADYPKCYPHLASIIYTWGWLVPGLNDPLRWMLALHNEFCLVVWTLVGIAAGAAWLVERTRVKGAWAAFFLFPGMFVYDANIAGGADHVVAFFAVPLFLAALRAAPDLSPRRCAAVGILAAGALLTRYQSLYLFIPVGALLAVRWLVLGTGLDRTVAVADRSRLWRGPATLIVLGALLSAPHFLKNWIFYGNPVYPFMVELFRGSHPVTGVPHQLTDEAWHPKGTFFVKLRNAVEMVFTYSFHPHYASPKNVGVIGSLFTLLLPTLPFLRRTKRLWVFTLMSLAVVFTWAWLYVIDRQAQIFVPLLATATAVMIVRAWELGWVARVGLVALVGMQLVWTGDAYFFSGYERLFDAVNLIKSGYEGNAKTRFRGYMAAEVAISKRLPPNAVVLFHNTRLSLGVTHKVLQDLAGFQGLISYRDLKTPRDVYDLYRSHGITHIVHQRGVWVAFSKQEEILFLAFIDRYGANLFREGGYDVIEMPTAPPPVEAPYHVLSLGLGGYADGVYPIEAMGVLEPIYDPDRRFPPPALAASPAAAAAPEIIDHVNAVLLGPGVRPPPALEAALRDKFTNQLTYGGKMAIYLRR
jgi:hypothetical protein